MPSIVSKRHNASERKRRVHAKSRNGCENCKLRRVKCDEARPNCRNCKLYGVTCDFTSPKASLDSSACGSFQVEFASSISTESLSSFKVVSSEHNTYERRQEPIIAVENEDVEAQLRTALPYMWNSTTLEPWSPISSNFTIASYIDNSLQHGSPGLDCLSNSSRVSSSLPLPHFSESHLEILARFQSRTALTIGDKRMAPAYRDVVCRLAFEHPFLMEMLLGLTLMHDADLSMSFSPALATKQKHASLQHWNVATQLFNQILAQDIPPSYRDAVWATGVHLGAASFWYTESTDPNKAWPLKPSEPDDLAWLKLGEGKRHLWRVADPTRPDSLFSSVMKYRPCLNPPMWMTSNDLSPIPEQLKPLFNINEYSTTKNNVYHLPVLILSRLQDVRLTHDNVLNFLYITAFITPEYLALLEIKDIRAVFIMGWWFRMLKDGELWWMARRAKVEGAAVSIWLQREDAGLARLLDSLVTRSVDSDLGLHQSAAMGEIGSCVQAWTADRPGLEVN